MPVFNGKIELVFAKEMPADQFGNVFRISIKDTAGNWYSWGGGKKQGITIKEGKNWVDVEGGDEVFFKYDVNGDFKNIVKSSMTVTTKGEGSTTATPKGNSQAPAQSSSAKPASGGYKKDTSGMSTGHCINAAMLLLNDKPKSNDELIATACQLHDITDSIKAITATKFPHMSEYDVGAASGHSVLNACKLVKKVGDVEAKALEILTEVVPAVTAYVKNEKVVDKVADKVDNSTPAGDYDSFDDDIPF